MKLIFLFHCLHWLPRACSLKLQIAVASPWANLQKRLAMRQMFQTCMALLSTEHSAEVHFFMADDNGISDFGGLERGQESAMFGDVVIVGGPDSDPIAERDATYVLERPTALAYRVGYATQWLVKNHSEMLDYIIYVDDDSYLHLPRLVVQLQQHDSPYLAMGHTMDTDLGWSRINICQVCTPCDVCLQNKGLERFCNQFPQLGLGECVMHMQRCDHVHDGQDKFACVSQKYLEMQKVVQYFGTTTAPTWFLGMGYVFGREIVDFIAANVGRLKMRGSADVLLGFWLAPLEHVRYVDMKGGYFHDYPMEGNLFASDCSAKSIVVHRMDGPDKWEGFDPQTCELHCPMKAPGIQDPIPVSLQSNMLSHLL